MHMYPIWRRQLPYWSWDFFDIEKGLLVLAHVNSYSLRSGIQSEFHSLEHSFRAANWFNEPKKKPYSSMQNRTPRITIWFIYTHVQGSKATRQRIPVILFSSTGANTFWSKIDSRQRTVSLKSFNKNQSWQSAMKVASKLNDIKCTGNCAIIQNRGITSIIKIIIHVWELWADIV